MAAVVMQVVEPWVAEIVRQNVALREEKAVWIRTLNERVDSLNRERNLRLDAEATRNSAQESATAAVLARRDATLARDAMIRLANQALATLPEGVILEDWTEMKVLEGLVRRLEREGACSAG